MYVSELAKSKLLEMYIQQNGDMSVAYTVHKKLNMEATEVKEDYLVLVFSDGTREVVNVADCCIDKKDGNVEIHGYVNNGQESRIYVITPEDYLERRNEADEYLWENVM